MYPPSPPSQWPHRHRRIDYSNSLPDECLSLIFSFLTTTNDRNNSSLVSHRWLRIDAQTRTHLTLKARSELQPFIPSIFNRFNSVTQLVLRKNPNSVGINNSDMILITSMCPHLTLLKLRYFQQLTDSGMAVFSKNCNKLKEFSCDECSFSDLGLVKLLNNCTQLEVLSVNRLYNACGDGALRNFNYVVVAKSLKVAELRSVYSDRFVEALIIGSKNLKTLKAICCGGNWDRCLEMIPDDNCLAEVHLECNVTDAGFSSISKCRDLTALHIDSSRCTNVGLINVAQNCKGLKKLYVGHQNKRSIDNVGLFVVGKHSVNLQELILLGIEASCVSLEAIATNCQNLVRIELCRSETITDVEMSCIAQKCVTLKILCIEECRVSNKGIEALGLGCPNLVNLRVTNCRKVTRKGVDLLRAKRGSLVVNWIC